ncbi:hypothetical protein BGX21_001229 [Mortierella sp. AD011]|nr:hypothetical protein BGX20_003287 [Mortierella sp. AD010]KAF9384715.1 hypothetical protein BGX21_001229 [Mortierella sp. AD011]
MVSSKPLPPIPAPAVEKEKRAQLFPSMTNPWRKSEPPAADSNASPTQVQTEQLQTQANTQTQPIGTISSISGMISSFISSTALSTTKAPTTESNHPSRPSTPVPTAATVVAVPLDTAMAAETAMAEETTPTVPAKQEMVTLDQRSFQHLRAIARQSIASSCLEPEILWLKLFMDVVQKLAANASDTWLQVEAAYESALEGQLERAATLVEKDKLNDKENHKGGKDKPVFSYRISLAKQISTKQECTFTVGRFEGESILQEEQSITEQRKSAEDDGIKILLGGTVFLAAGSEDLHKAGKIVEILVFALCSLQLETYLMRDHDVLRPDPALNIHEADAKFSKPPITTQYSHDTSKRASKGSMFFGWLSRGSLPAKYKKGTTQLALDSDTKLDQYRNNSGSGAVNAISSSSDDFGLVDDPQGFQNCRFAKIIQQVEKAIISVSPNVVFPPPHILLRLRDEEAFGLDSMRKPYNWEDVEFVARKIGFGNRMSRQNTGGVSKVARFGAITGVAQSDGSKANRNRLPADSRAGLDHLMTNSNSLQGIFNHQSISFSYSYYWSATAAAPCHPPNLITVEYYRKEGQYEDMGLGEMIEFICKRAYSKCSDPTCEHKRLEHISTYTHGEARINITVEQPRPDSATNFDSEEFTPFLSNNKTIAMWTRCKMCKARTKPKALSRASRLYSFGKYLELLLYGQRFEPGPRPLCDHMATKDSIARCFLYRGLVVTFEYESIDLFEMRISRLQVHEDFHPMPRFDPGHTDEDKHEYSTAYSTSTGPSPRASVLSVYLNTDYITEKEQVSLLDATRLEILHFYESCKKIIVIMEQHLGETKSISKYAINKARDSSNAVAMDPIKKAALDRLDELGERWKADEFDLYDQLKRISICRLNDLRNRFGDCIKRTMRSMEAWQKEYNPESLKSSKGQLDWVLPEYFTHDALHTFPGSSVIVREDEPSSIIASTLSSSDYLSLISSLLHPDSESAEVEEKAPLPPEKDFDINGLNIPTRGPLKTSRSVGSVTLTPRKNGSSGSEGSTAHGSPGKESSASQKGELETEDDIDEDEEEDEDDSFLVVDGYQTSVKFLPASKVDLSSLIQNGTMSPRNTIGLNFGGRHSKNLTLSPNTVDKKGDLAATRPFSMVALPNSTPALTTSLIPANGEETPTNSFFVSPPERSITPTPDTKSKGAFGYHSLTSGLSGTMKGLSLNTLSEKIGGGFSSYSMSGTYSEKAEREHFSDSVDKAMKETLAIGSLMEKRRFRVWFIMQRSLTLFVDGAGSTKLMFHRSRDVRAGTPMEAKAKAASTRPKVYAHDRFVIKQMVSSWNIAEKDALLKFAPKYFEYMEKTNEAPTVLAKIFGFYTLKIKNGESGHALKIDVLVMEHLFYNQKITRTFDLKGIQDRHAASKPNAGGGGSTTLWDGDFIEGRYKTLLLLYSHSKRIIRESLLNDTEFLAGANIMDYSLLVGVDDERKELVVGIVDFIGAYTWYKRIESKGKTTLRGAKDSVTVLPPQQYKTRFREAMERYFLAVPDKWSKNAVEQNQEAMREATNVTIPSTIPEVSKETLTTPSLEQKLKNKTSGYLEKMSKALLSSKVAGDMSSSTTLSATDQNDKLIEASDDVEHRGQKLPRVFHPLN